MISDERWRSGHEPEEPRLRVGVLPRRHAVPDLLVLRREGEQDHDPRGVVRRPLLLVGLAADHGHRQGDLEVLVPRRHGLGRHQLGHSTRTSGSP